MQDLKLIKDVHEYQELALRTESVVDQVVADKAELLHVLAMYNTIGEMLDCLKKKIYYRNPDKYNLNFEKLSNDLKYFTTCADRHHGERFEEVLEGVDPRVFHAIIGIATEAAELVNALQKNVAGHELDAVNVAEEWGDACWYGDGILLDQLGIDGMWVRTINIEKLRARYPDKYSDVSAEARDLNVERDILRRILENRKNGNENG